MKINLFQKSQGDNPEERMVSLTVLNETGHSTKTCVLAEVKEEVRPGRMVIVNGHSCADWDEVLDEVKRTPVTDPLEVVSAQQIGGG